MNPSTLLFGREDELRIIERLLRREEGDGAAILIRGEPGIGKSALLAEAAKRASDAGMLTLDAVGVEVEAKLAFAGLHQLLRPTLDRAPPAAKSSARGIVGSVRDG
jgi:hypothetical protein